MKVRKKKGFSLVEILVAISIIVVLTSVTMIRFNSLNIDVDFNLAVEEMVFNLRQTQLFALTGQTSNGIRPDGGWGMRIEQCSVGACSYTVYADSYPSGGNRLYDSGSDDKFVDIYLNDKVYISNVEPANSGVLDVVFSIPQGDIFINGVDTIDTATVTISNVVDLSQRQIVIKKDGFSIKVPSN